MLLFYTKVKFVQGHVDVRGLVDVRTGTQFQLTSKPDGVFLASQLDEIFKLRLVLKHKDAEGNGKNLCSVILKKRSFVFSHVKSKKQSEFSYLYFQGFLKS